MVGVKQTLIHCQLGKAVACHLECWQIKPLITEFDFLIILFFFRFHGFVLACPCLVHTVCLIDWPLTCFDFVPLPHFYHETLKEDTCIFMHVQGFFFPLLLLLFFVLVKKFFFLKHIQLCSLRFGPLMNCQMESFCFFFFPGYIFNFKKYELFPINI